MATFVLTDAVVSINSVDLSDHVRSVTLNIGAEQVDPTAMGDDTRLNKAGLKTWSLDVEFNQDFAAGEVDATLEPLVGAAAFAIAVKPTSATTGATNPDYQGNAVLETYPPIDGAVGDMAIVAVTFQAAGTLTRAVA